MKQRIDLAKGRFGPVFTKATFWGMLYPNRIYQ